MRPIGKNFYKQESSMFKSGYAKSNTVVSLTPVVSSYSPLSSKYVGGLRPYYQQNKYSLRATSSPLLSSHIESVNIHKIHDDHIEISSSFSNKNLKKNLLNNENSSSILLDKV